MGCSVIDRADVRYQQLEVHCKQEQNARVSISQELLRLQKMIEEWEEWFVWMIE